MSKKLLTAQEVADLIQVNKSWVYAATRANRIPHMRLGRYVRYSDEAIDQWLGDIQAGLDPRDAGRGRPRRKN